MNATGAHVRGAQSADGWITGQAKLDRINLERWNRGESESPNRWGLRSCGTPVRSVRHDPDVDVPPALAIAIPVSTNYESRIYSLDPSLRGPSNETLLARFIAGDADAFALLLSRLERPIFSFILRMLNDRQLAEDVFQDVFVRLLRGAASFQPTQSLSAWVFRIARNLCIDTIRRQKHRQTISLEDGRTPGAVGAVENGERGRLAEQLPGTGPSPDTSAMTSELSQRLGDAVNRLSPELREVVLLKEASGLTFKEIAELTETPESTLKSRMQTALEKLRTELNRLVR